MSRSPRAGSVLLLLLGVACAGHTPQQHVVYADYGPFLSEAEWQSPVCQQTAQSFAQGDSSRLQFLQRWVRSCAPGALTERAAHFDAHRTSTDPVLLEHVARPAHEWVDGAMFQVAEAIAADPTASTEARVTALRVLHWALFPGSYLGVEQITQDPPSGIDCPGGNHSLHMRLHLGTPLPEDFVMRIDAVVTRLRTEPATAVPLRNAAHCLRSSLYFWRRA